MAIVYGRGKTPVKDVKLVRYGADRAAITAYVLNSSEFAINLVDSLYLQVLARPADAGGLATFFSQLAAGTTPDLVIAQMVVSDENYSGS